MFTSRRTELSEYQAVGGHDAHQIVDFSEFETDFTSPFQRSGTHKNQWLLTTGVAGLVGAMVVGGTLLGTFGLGGIERRTHTAEVIQTAEILQKPDATADEADSSRPLLGVLGMARIVGRREISDESDSATTATASLQGDDRTSPLIGSLAPEYPVSSSPTRTRPSRPQVIAATPDAGDPLRTAALTPASIGDSTSIGVRRSPTRQTEIVIDRGQTLVGILTSRGVPRYEARRLIAALEPVYPTRLLKDGQRLKFSYATERDSFGQTVTRPVSLELTGDTRQVVVALNSEGRFEGNYTETGKAIASTPREPKHVRMAGKISKNFFASAKAKGVPRTVIAEMMRVHSFDVDFQREVRSGDRFDVFFGEPLAGPRRKGRKVVLYSELTLKRATSKGYYRFTTPDDGITGYYDREGRSVSGMLMRTPVSGARVSSRFGMRKHPILGYSRMHTGIDFAAPRGTPIKAAGDGIIERAGRAGAYGKYIRIKHGKGYKTAYAHMHRFAKGMKPGKRVRQGQVIGYVGTTGRSTGPHLHYEVHRNGKKVNPSKVHVAKGRVLKGKILAEFKKQRNQIDAMRAEAGSSTKVAQVSQ